jgi:AraC family transcriptional regulator
MHVSSAEILPLLRIVRRRLDGDLSLAALSAAARQSPFVLHRAFRRVTGETTKRYTSRLRLERAAAELLLSPCSILEVALDSGFASHEVFTRAFLRRFGMSPRAYRTRGLIGPRGRQIVARHAAIVLDAGPCIGLHHLSTAERSPEMPVAISRRQLDPQPALIIRRKIKVSDIAATLGEILPKVFAFAQQRGVPLAGPPMARYVEMSRGTFTIEGGFAIATPAAGDGEIEAIELPGGPAAVAIHAGPYDRLEDTHAAIASWIDAQKLTAAGGPWETYITDPADKPDPKDWQTEVVHPLAR